MHAGFALAVAVMVLQPPAATDVDGLTPMMRAAARGDGAGVAAAIAGGADVDATHETTRLSPLMFAAYFGHDVVVRALLEKGAQANLKDATGASAADWAVQGGHESAAEMLRKAGAQMNPFLNVGVLPFPLMDKAAGKTSGAGGRSVRHVRQ